MMRAPAGAHHTRPPPTVARTYRFEFLQHTASWCQLGGGGTVSSEHTPVVFPPIGVAAASRVQEDQGPAAHTASATRLTAQPVMGMPPPVARQGVCLHLHGTQRYWTTL